MNGLAYGAALVASALLIGGCGESAAQNEGEADLTAQAKAAAVSAGFDPSAFRDGELHVYTWCDYIAPAVLASFEKAFGCTVVVDTFDSNEAMYAKLKAGGTGYDIIMPSSYQIEAMVAEGMIVPLDHAKMPNVRKNFDARFANQILDPSFRYNVPYAVTYTGFLYDKAKLEGLDAATWQILGESSLRGRISLLDDIREVIGAGLMHLGHSINSTNPAEIDAAVEQVLKWRGNVRKFDGESYKTEVPGGSTWLGHGYSTDATQVIVGDDEEGIPPRDDLGFALPKEGFTISFDEIVIAKTAPNPDLAHVFVNYLYDGEVAAENMNYICGPNPVAPGIELLDDAYRALIILPDDVISRGQVLKGFADRPEVMELYNRAWDRIKATEAR